MNELRVMISGRIERNTYFVPYTAKPRSVWETVEWRRGRRDGVIDGDVMANQYGSGRDGAG